MGKKRRRKWLQRNQESSASFSVLFVDSVWSGAGGGVGMRLSSSVPWARETVLTPSSQIRKSRYYQRVRGENFRARTKSSLPIHGLWAHLLPNTAMNKLWELGRYSVVIKYGDLGSTSWLCGLLACDFMWLGCKLYNLFKLPLFSKMGMITIIIAVTSQDYCELKSIHRNRIVTSTE